MTPLTVEAILVSFRFIVSCSFVVVVVVVVFALVNNYLKGSFVLKSISLITKDDLIQDN